MKYGRRIGTLVVGLVFALIGSVSAFDKIQAPTGLEPPEGQVLQLARSVVDIHTFGTGWGYIPDFATRKIRKCEGSFGMQGSGFMVSNRYIVTAAHIVEPRSLIIRQGESSLFNTGLYGISSRTILVGDGLGDGGIPATIVYSDKENDIAVLEVSPHRTQAALTPLPIPIERTFMAVPIGLSFLTLDRVAPGDAVVALVRARDEDGDRHWIYEIRKGTIVANKPIVPPEIADILPWFNLNDITLNLKLYPGDSGSPLIAFHQGKPIIIGVVRALCLIDESTSYAVRIDGIVRIFESE